MFYKVVVFYLIILLAGCHDSSAKEYSDMDDIDCSDASYAPIENRISAICFALSRGNIKDDVDSKDMSRWFVNARYTSSVWRVTITSLGIIPSFFCEIEFDKSGDVIPDSSPDVFCEYMK